MAIKLTKPQKSILSIVAATLVAILLIWALWPKALSESEIAAPEGDLAAPTLEGEVGDETPINLNGAPQNDGDVSNIINEAEMEAAETGAKLPAPNSAELVRLHEEALAGNKESLEEICKYVTGSDMYDLGDFKASEELTTSCGEFRPSNEPED